MSFLKDWAKKYGESKISGIDPSSSPQKFLGQILNNVVGDKESTDGDSVRESASPIDFLAPEAVGVLSAMAKRGSQVVAEAAPRILGNEIGSVGSDINKIIPKLDLSKEARLARAKEMGFDTDNVLYHGSTKNIDVFDPTKSRTTPGISLTPDANFADRFTRTLGAPTSPNLPGANITPVYIKKGKIFDPDDPEHFSSLKKYLDESFGEERKGGQFPDLRRIKNPQHGWEESETPLVDRFLKQNGFDGQHTYEDGIKNLQLKNPSSIRSINAEFDPSKIDSSDILSSNDRFEALKSLLSKNA